MGNLHQSIVHHIGQMVGRHAVALEEDFVVQLRSLHHHQTPDTILNADFSSPGHFESNHVRLSGFQASGHLIRRQAQRVFHADPADRIVLRRSNTRSLELFPHGIQLLLGIKGVIGMPRFHQLHGILSVHGLAFALTVRAKSPAFVDAFVKLNPAPAKRFNDKLLGPRDKPGLIRVLNS